MPQQQSSDSTHSSPANSKDEDALCLPQFLVEGLSVGDIVGEVVGLVDGDAVGMVVGLKVGEDVGEVVGLAVGLEDVDFAQPILDGSPR